MKQSEAEQIMKGHKIEGVKIKSHKWLRYGIIATVFLVLSYVMLLLGGITEINVATLLETLLATVFMTIVVSDVNERFKDEMVIELVRDDKNIENI